MKYYPSQVTHLLSLISSGQIKALLLYGPDKGYINKICLKIKNQFELFQTSIEFKSLNISSCKILFNAGNFFAKKELIKIQSVTNSISQDLKTILSSDFLHLPIFIADELAGNSSVKKFFETEQHLASVGCYYDDAQKIEKIVLHVVNLAKKNIHKDALSYLKLHLKGDHQLICNELDKIMYFVHDKVDITLDDVRSVMSHDLMASGDELCIHFANKDYENFLREFGKLKDQNINEVLIIRALTRYYTNLYIVLSHMRDNTNLEKAMLSLSPPIFYKYISDFKKIVKNITLAEVICTLSKLHRAEMNFKLAPAGFDLYCALCGN